AQADTEWKFARGKLWISYFDEGGTLPTPFNIIPSPKSFLYAMAWLKDKVCSCSKRHQRSKWQSIRKVVKKVNEKEARYQSVMRDLIKRYLMVRQKSDDKQGVTEDDLNEIKGDISAFRFELLEIFRTNGMRTPAHMQQRSTKLRRRGSKRSMQSRRYGRFPGGEDQQQQQQEGGSIGRFDTISEEESDSLNGSVNGWPLAGRQAGARTPTTPPRRRLPPLSSQDSSESFQSSGAQASPPERRQQQQQAELALDPAQLPGYQRSGTANSDTAAANAAAAAFTKKTIGAVKKVSFNWNQEDDNEQERQRSAEGDGGSVYVYDGSPEASTPQPQPPHPTREQPQAPPQRARGERRSDLSGRFGGLASGTLAFRLSWKRLTAAIGPDRDVDDDEPAAPPPPRPLGFRQPMEALRRTGTDSACRQLLSWATLDSSRSAAVTNSTLAELPTPTEGRLRNGGTEDSRACWRVPAAVAAAESELELAAVAAEQPGREGEVPPLPRPPPWLYSLLSAAAAVGGGGAARRSGARRTAPAAVVEDVADDDVSSAAAAAAAAESGSESAAAAAVGGWARCCQPSWLEKSSQREARRAARPASSVSPETNSGADSADADFAQEFSAAVLSGTGTEAAEAAEVLAGAACFRLARWRRSWRARASASRRMNSRKPLNTKLAGVSPGCTRLLTRKTRLPGKARGRGLLRSRKRRSSKRSSSCGEGGNGVDCERIGTEGSGLKDRDRIGTEGSGLKDRDSGLKDRDCRIGTEGSGLKDRDSGRDCRIGTDQDRD
uniref:Ion_trans domain-containing protein n=1 Tax=Macrostomum lignano TaxID=282301 RepID=A0A1I8GN43_9PLAT